MEQIRLAVSLYPMLEPPLGSAIFGRRDRPCLVRTTKLGAIRLVHFRHTFVENKKRI